MKKHNIEEIEIEKTSDSYAKHSVMIYGDEENIYMGEILNRCTSWIDAELVNLEPEEGIPEHRHDRSEEIGFVLNGDGEIIQPDDHQRIKKNDLVFMEHGVPHEIRAGHGGLSVLFFHSPPMHDRK